MNSHLEVEQSETPYIPYQEDAFRGTTSSLEEGLKNIDALSSTYSPSMVNSKKGGDGDNDDDTDNRSTLTEEGIHDLQGYIIICMVVLIGDMARGVMYPTLWPLVSSLGGSEITQGYTVAAFSFGRIMASPVFGERSTTHGYRSTLILSCSILIFGTIMYAFASSINSLIFSQTILGVGSGTLGVTRAFVAEVTPTRDRTQYMAYLTAVQYGGFTITPIIGAFFARVLNDQDEKEGLLNKYSAPAYFMTFISSIVLTALILKLDDRPRTKSAKKKQVNSNSNDMANSLTWIGITVYDAAILGCMLLNVSTKGSIACFETLGITFALEHFDMDSSSAGFLVSTCGSIGVFVLLQMRTLSKYFNDIQMIVGGMLVILLASATLIGLKDEEQMPMWRYVVVIFLVYSVGYPVGHTAVIGMFSKIVGRRPQGKLLGWFASAGSLARVLFPIMSGYITRFEGDSALFVALVIVLSASIAFVWTYKNILITFSK